jgi:hypothetical protein
MSLLCAGTAGPSVQIQYHSRLAHHRHVRRAILHVRRGSEAAASRNIALQQSLCGLPSGIMY